MNSLKFLFAKLWIAFTFMTPYVLAVETNQCDDAFAEKRRSLLEKTKIPYLVLESSDQAEKMIDQLPAIPLPQVYRLFLVHVQKRTANQTHPLSVRLEDPNHIGRVLIQFRKVFPSLIEIESLAKLSRVEESEFLKIRAQTLKSVSSLIFKSRASTEEFFAADSALKLLSLIESRVKFSISAEIAAQAEEEARRESEQQQKESEKEEENEQEQDPQWNDPQDRYKPENKDVNDGKGKGGKVSDLYRTTVSTSYKLYPQIYYDNISQFEMLTNHAIRPTPNALQSQRVEGKSWVVIAGKSLIDLPNPYGFEPMVGQYTGFSVVEKGVGEFKLVVTDQSLKSVMVPMTTARSVAFQNGARPENYTLPTGISFEQWPDSIKNFIQANRGRSPIDFAESLSKFLSEDGEFIYFSKGPLIDENEFKRLQQQLDQLKLKYPEPVAMARLGSFNCDGAAWIAASILRDVMKIPTRTVGGRTSAGKRMIGNELYHVLRGSDPLHMWIEVWNGNQWIPLDPTPVKNDPQGAGSSDDLIQDKQKNAADQANKNREQQQSGSQNSQQQGQKKSQQEKDAQGGNSQGDSSDGKKDKTGQTDGKGDAKSQSEKDDKGQEGEVQKEAGPNVTNSYSKSTPISPNEYLNDLLSVLETHTLERALVEKNPSQVIQEFFNREDSLISDYEQWKKFIEVSKTRVNFVFTELTEGGNLDQAQWVGRMSTLFSKGEYRELYRELTFMKRLISEIKTRRPLRPQETQFLGTLDRILKEMLKVRHKNSEAFDIVDNIITRLPGPASKAYLTEAYGSGVTDVSSLSMLNAANDFKSGRLQLITRMSLLNPFVDLLLNSEKKPNYDKLKLFERSSKPAPDRDLVVARSVNELPFFLFRPRAGENLFAPLVRGEQFSLGPRETVLVRNPKSYIERKVIVVYYDVSGSMQGANVEFQDSLLLTILDKAFAERDPFGKPTNQVYLAPFGTNVGQLAHIQSIEQAAQYIRGKVNFPTTANDGTDIQSALVHFYDLVAKAHAKGQKNKDVANFKNATMVLLTDGGSQIDMNTVMSYRKQLPKELKVYLNFLAIGSSNPTLEELAKISALGSQKPFFRLFAQNEISDFINKSTQIKANENAFATDKKKGEMPNEVRAALTKLTQELTNWNPAYSAQTLSGIYAGVSADTQIKLTPKQTEEFADFVRAVRRVQKQTWPQDVRLRVAVQLSARYIKQSGRAKTQLAAAEVTILQELKDWAIGR